MVFEQKTKEYEHMKKSNIVNGNIIICRIMTKKNVVFPTCFFYENIGCTIM